MALIQTSSVTGFSSPEPVNEMFLNMTIRREEQVDERGPKI